MNNNLKRFVGLFLYTIFVGFLIYRGILIQKYLQRLTSETFNPHGYLIFITIFPVIIGLLIALPYFISILKTEGSLKFDWIKFIAIGLPTFYITIFHLIYFSPLGKYIPKFLNNISLIMGSVHTVAGVVFGYLILATFYKED